MDDVDVDVEMENGHLWSIKALQCWHRNQKSSRKIKQTSRGTPRNDFIEIN